LRPSLVVQLLLLARAGGARLRGDVADLEGVGEPNPGVEVLLVRAVAGQALLALLRPRADVDPLAPLEQPLVRLLGLGLDVRLLARLVGGRDGQLDFGLLRRLRGVLAGDGGR
jgi:hypothetical protein